MPRQTKIFTITSEGRDLGKKFLLTEMPAYQAEKWAYKTLLALSRGGFELPQGIFDAGMAGLAAVVPYLMVIGFRSLHAARWEELEILLDEMMTCVKYQPDKAELMPQDIRTDATSQIEEVRTRVELRKEVLMLHVNPFDLAAFRTLVKEDSQESQTSSATSTSQP
jgi:hypothetical protein